MKDFEQVDHTADMQIRAYGKTRKELFTNALKGMFQSIQPIIEGCTVQNERVICDALPVKREVDVESPDDIALMVDFLSEALYLSDIHDEAYLDADISELSENTIHATLHGAKIQGFEVVEIKAVTYHGLEIKQVNDTWQADIVFDI